MDAAEFARWASDLMDRKVRPEGDDQRGAYRAGWRAGRLRVDSDTVTSMMGSLDAWQAACFRLGHGDGARMPPATLAQLQAAEQRAAAFRQKISR